MEIVNIDWLIEHGFQDYRCNPSKNKRVYFRHFYDDAEDKEEIITYEKIYSTKYDYKTRSEIEDNDFNIYINLLKSTSGIKGDNISLKMNLELNEELTVEKFIGFKFD